MHIWKSKIWRNLIRKYSKILLFFFKVLLVSHHAQKIVICYLVPANSHDKVWPHYCFKQQKMNFEEFVFFKCEKKWPKQISHNFSVKKSYKKNIFFDFFIIFFFFYGKQTNCIKNYPKLTKTCVYVMLKSFGKNNLIWIF